MATETLRPNGPGDEENIPCVIGDGLGTHWVTVDEPTPDDDGTYIYDNTETYHRDLFSLTDHSTGQGAISRITVYGRFQAIAYSPAQESAKICIKTGGAVYEQAFQLAAKDIWYNLSKEWVQNPNTGTAWTWSDIDSLQAGCALRKCKADVTCRTKCTQLYVIVEYTPGEDKSSAESGGGSDVSASNAAAISAAESGQGQETAVTDPSFKLSADGGQSQESGTTPQGTKAAADTGISGDAVLLAKGESSADTAGGKDSLAAIIQLPNKGGGMKLWT